MLSVLCRAPDNPPAPPAPAASPLHAPAPCMATEPCPRGACRLPGSSRAPSSSRALRTAKLRASCGGQGCSAQAAPGSRAPGALPRRRLLCRALSSWQGASPHAATAGSAVPSASWQDGGQPLPGPCLVPSAAGGGMLWASSQLPCVLGGPASPSSKGAHPKRVQQQLGAWR